MLTILLLTLFTTAFALPTDINHTFHVRNSFTGVTRAITGTLHCETTKASPRLHETRSAAEMLRAKDPFQYCSQDNGVGSECTRLVSSGGGDISLCGTWNAFVRCNDAADAAIKIVDGCKWFDYAGGYWRFSDKNLNLVVH